MTTINETENNKTLDLKPGGKLRVVLDENPTTGYIWELGKNKPEHITFDGKSSTDFHKAVGSGHSAVFEFTVTSNGESSITLILQRPWESQSEKTFTVTIVS